LEEAAKHQNHQNSRNYQYSTSGKMKEHKTKGHSKVAQNGKTIA